MASNHGALVVFGSGPGVGRAIAALFARRGFDMVVLMSRDAVRLAQDAEIVRSSGQDTNVREVAIDLGDAESVQQGVQRTEELLKDVPLECVLFNAARTGKSEFFDFPPESLESDLKIAVVSLYVIAQWALPRLLETANTSSKTPSLLVTSGMLAKDPFPAMFSLAACKAAQYSLVTSLHKEYEPRGVHCGVIIIGGTVSDDSKITNPRNIAEEAWEMFSQPRCKGKLEVMLADPAYSDHIKNRER